MKKLVKHMPIIGAITVILAFGVTIALMFPDRFAKLAGLGMNEKPVIALQTMSRPSHTEKKDKKRAVSSKDKQMLNNKITLTAMPVSYDPVSGSYMKDLAELEMVTRILEMKASIASVVSKIAQTSLKTGVSIDCVIKHKGAIDNCRSNAYSNGIGTVTTGSPASIGSTFFNNRSSTVMESSAYNNQQIVDEPGNSVQTVPSTGSDRIALADESSSVDLGDLMSGVFEEGSSSASVEKREEGSDIHFELNIIGIWGDKVIAKTSSGKTILLEKEPVTVNGVVYYPKYVSYKRVVIVAESAKGHVTKTFEILHSL